MQSILIALGLCTGCAKSDVMTQREFANEFAEALRSACPGLKVEIVPDNELKITTTEGSVSTSFLDNAYDTYRIDPGDKAAVIKRFVTAGLETILDQQSSKKLDRTRIIPVIKERSWLEEITKAVASRGSKKPLENVFEDLSPDLVIVYAEDSPKNINYLQAGDLERARVTPTELRNLACENLRRLLPKIEKRGSNGLFMLTAGGDYEASLLLIDSIWEDMQKEVKGEIVVAIPTRDLLIVTGSEDRQGIEKMKQIVQKAFAQGSYRLTKKLFVRKGGKFEEFKAE